MWDGTHDMGWWMVAWMAVGGLAWLVLAGVVAAIVSNSWNRGGDRAKPESALDVARRRYAAGEISEEEFERIRRNLG